MSKLQLPYVKMPMEFTTLLKSDLSSVTTPSPVFDVIKPNRALYRVLETSFKEFDDGRGVEKLVVGLGWPNFRERMASLYVYKAIFGEFPTKTNMELVDDIKNFETNFRDHGVHGNSRLFMLALYIRLANIQVQTKNDGQSSEIKIPPSIHLLLKLSQGRAQKIDWLLLILSHLSESLGENMVTAQLGQGKKLNEIYEFMSLSDRESMHQNLLAYSASINEPDFFLYEKV